MLAMIVWRMSQVSDGSGIMAEVGTCFTAHA